MYIHCMPKVKCALYTCVSRLMCGQVNVPPILPNEVFMWTSVVGLLTSVVSLWSKQNCVGWIS